jgi:hypothetical protein
MHKTYTSLTCLFLPFWLLSPFWAILKCRDAMRYFSLYYVPACESQYLEHEVFINAGYNTKLPIPALLLIDLRQCKPKCHPPSCLMKWLYFWKNTSTSLSLSFSLSLLTYYSFSSFFSFLFSSFSFFYFFLLIYSVTVRCSIQNNYFLTLEH